MFDKGEEKEGGFLFLLPPPFHVKHNMAESELS